MKKKFPCHLPGKELWGPHFHPVQAASLSAAELAKEINPLWKRALQQGWITEQEAEQFQKELAAKQTANIWGKIQHWNNHINWHLSKDSHAGAAWLILKNLHRARRQWLAFRRPYEGLRAGTLESVEQALIISAPFEGLLAPEYQIKNRHILAGIVLLSGLRDEELAVIGRELLGVAAIETSPDPFYRRLVISHGVPFPKGEWAEPTLEQVARTTTRLEKTLSDEGKDWIEAISSRPSPQL